MAGAITRGTGCEYLAPKDCEPGQGRPARHSAVAMRSCNDLAQPGTGLVKDPGRLRGHGDGKLAPRWPGPPPAWARPRAGKAQRGLQISAGGV
jgi:hypothetical protein